MTASVVQGQVVVGGSAEGLAIRLDEPLSLWGGLDPASGRVIDAHHPQHGSNLSGRVVLMPAARGSSSSSSVLAEAIRAGSAPAAILIGESDLILAVGSVVAEELYGRSVPIVVLPAAAMAAIPDSARVAVSDGSIAIYEDRLPH